MDFARMVARTAVLVSLVSVGFLAASPASAQVMPSPIPAPDGLISGFLDQLIALIQGLLGGLL